jgi:hypothetical protein
MSSNPLHSLRRCPTIADALLLLSFPDGTHIAAIIGGNYFGIAKKTFIRCIKVLDADGVGDNDLIISAISIAIDAIRRSGKPSIISMCVATLASQAMDDAVCTLPVKCDHAAYTNMCLTGEKRH